MIAPETKFLRCDSAACENLKVFVRLERHNARKHVTEPGALVASGCRHQVHRGALFWIINAWESVVLDNQRLGNVF